MPSTKRSRSSSTQPAVTVDRDITPVKPADLLGKDHPRHNVGVVLHLGQEHGVAGPQVGPAPRVRHQVERFGGVLREDDLVRRILSADETPRRHDTGPLVERRGLLGRGVHAAVHVGVGRLVVARHGADHGLGLQTGRGRIEIHDRVGRSPCGPNSGKSLRSASTLERRRRRRRTRPTSRGTLHRQGLVSPRSRPVRASSGPPLLDDAPVDAGCAPGRAPARSSRGVRSG